MVFLINGGGELWQHIDASNEPYFEQLFPNSVIYDFLPTQSPKFILQI